MRCEEHDAHPTGRRIVSRACKSEAGFISHGLFVCWRHARQRCACVTDHVRSLKNAAAAEQHPGAAKGGE